MNGTSSLPVRSSGGWIKALIWIAAGLFVLGMGVLGALAALWLGYTVPGQQAAAFLQWLFAPKAAQTAWFFTRAAGLTAYLLLWLSTLWGLALPTRLLDGKLHGAFTFEFHQFISLLSLVFTLAHAAVLLFDQYLPFSIAQLLFPFLSEYRPFWTGLGILSFYIALLVSVTYYLKNKIGMRAFRAIHIASLLGFFGASLHGLAAGTDSALPLVRLLYAGASLSVVFLTVYWLAGKLFKPAKRPVQAV